MVFPDLFELEYPDEDREEPPDGGRGSSAAFEELAAARTQLRAEIAAHREQFGEHELRRLARGVGGGEVSHNA